MHKKKMNKEQLIIYLSMVCFFTISILTLYSADKVNSNVDNIIIKQIIWTLLGILLISFMVFIGNKIIIKNIWYLYIFGNITLLLLLITGVPINNARCWFKIPGMGTIQPSEFIKIILIIVLARYINKYRKSNPNNSVKNEFVLLFKVFLITIPPTILTFLEPDTGAVFMYFILTFIILFVGRIRFRWFAGLSLFIIIAVGFIFLIYYTNIDLFIKIFGNSFFLRIERLLNWSSSSGMQLENSVASIGSSGLFGYGIGNNPIYIPEAHTDFIFSIASTNFGFLGSSIIIFLIILFDITICNVAIKSKTQTNKYIVFGILGILVYQQIQNISMTFGLLPITGITLPFISYGGSSLLSYMIMIGFVINICRENNKYYN